MYYDYGDYLDFIFLWIRRLRRFWSCLGHFWTVQEVPGLNLDLLNCCFQILSLSCFFDPKITKFGRFLCSLIFCASGERETTLNQNYFCAQAEKGQSAPSGAERAANRRRSVNQTKDRTKTKNSDRHHRIPQSQILENKHQKIRRHRNSQWSLFYIRKYNIVLDNLIFLCSLVFYLQAF